jgi:hypothetical protein
MAKHLSIEEEIAQIASVLVNRNVDVATLVTAMKQDKATSEQILSTLVGTLYTGIAYGNW